MKSHNERATLDDVLNDYVAASSQPSKKELTEWIRRYPQYARELTEFTVSWSLTERLPPAPHADPVTEDTLVLRGISIVQNLLHQQQEQKSDDNVATFAGLLSEGAKLGLSIQDQAEQSELSIQLIRKFDRRLIQFISIPQEAIQTIARTLRRHSSVIAQYLQGKPLPIHEARYKAKQRPVLSEKEDFFAAVRSDTTMSESQRERWLRLEPPDK